MNRSPKYSVDVKTIDLATFCIRGSTYGIDLLKIQEVNKLRVFTAVPGAPDYVRGILNLRGRIVTLIDLGHKLGLSETDVDARARNIIVLFEGERIGLLVERISEVIQVPMNHVETPPANINGIQGDHFHGVVKTSDCVIGILNIEKVLE